MSGAGFIPAALVAGGTMALTKVAEEAYEAAQGYQRQSPSDILRDAAFEGVLGVTGEGVGRLISRVFGRFIRVPLVQRQRHPERSLEELLEKRFLSNNRAGRDQD